jgi:hypothetical protein
MVSEFKIFCFLIAVIVVFTSNTSAKLRSIVLKMIFKDIFFCTTLKNIFNYHKEMQYLYINIT